MYATTDGATSNFSIIKDGPHNLPAKSGSIVVPLLGDLLTVKTNNLLKYLQPKESPEEGAKHSNHCLAVIVCIWQGTWIVFVESKCLCK
jgi:hypothetical protein